jgi:hypothetical protein
MFNTVKRCLYTFVSDPPSIGGQRNLESKSKFSALGEKIAVSQLYSSLVKIRISFFRENLLTSQIQRLLSLCRFIAVTHVTHPYTTCFQHQLFKNDFYRFSLTIINGQDLQV